MRRILLAGITAVAVGVPLVAGTALAVASSDDRTRSDAGFELEIDPDLDAAFGPRPVNATQAAAIIARQFPGARVTEAELDERGGGPIWEMTFVLRGGEREVDVDAVSGAILGGAAGADDSAGDGRTDDGPDAADDFDDLDDDGGVLGRQRISNDDDD